jgi:hypothetical protein
MATRKADARVPEELEAAARQATPELADASISVLIRVALAVLAGHTVHDALARAGGRRGRRPVPRDFTRDAT